MSAEGPVHRLRARLLLPVVVVAALTVGGADVGCGARLWGQGRNPTDSQQLVVEELAGFVGEARESAFGYLPAVRLYDPVTLNLLLECDAGTPHPDTEAFLASMYMALGVIEEASEAAAMFADPLSQQAVGFYDEQSGTLAVADLGGEWGTFVRSTIVHELVHAHQDQRGALGWLDSVVAAGDEQADVAQALWEGEASLIEFWYLGTLSDAETDAYLAEWEELTGEYPSLPAFLEARMAYPYDTGRRVVEAAYEAGGWKAVDSLFAFPPPTTEWLEDPEAPQPDGWITDWALEFERAALAAWGVCGKNDLDAFFAASPAEPPLATWGDDSYEIYWDGEHALVVLYLIGDDRASTLEYHRAFAEHRVATGIGIKGMRIYLNDHQLVVVASTDPDLLTEAGAQLLWLMDLEL